MIFYHFFDNTHVRIKIYREFYRSIIYIANEDRHVRISSLLHPWVNRNNYIRFGIVPVNTDPAFKKCYSSIALSKFPIGL